MKATVLVVEDEEKLRRVIELQLKTAGQDLAIGDLRPAETRVVQVPAGDYVTIEFDASQHRSWRSPDRTSAAQSMTVAIRANERVDWNAQRPRVP